MHYHNNRWVEERIDSVTDVAVYATLHSFSPFMLTIKNSKSAVMYIDEFAVFEKGSAHEYCEMEAAIELYFDEYPMPDFENGYGTFACTVFDNKGENLGEWEIPLELVNEGTSEYLRAAGQFWNSYGYAGNPILMVDEDGNWFWLIPIAVGAASGALNAAVRGEDVFMGAVVGAGIGLIIISMLPVLLLQDGLSDFLLVCVMNIYSPKNTKKVKSNLYTYFDLVETTLTIGLINLYCFDLFFGYDIGINERIAYSYNCGVSIWLRQFEIKLGITNNKLSGDVNIAFKL